MIFRYKTSQVPVRYLSLKSRECNINYDQFETMNYMHFFSLHISAVARLAVNIISICVSLIRSISIFTRVLSIKSSLWWLRDSETWPLIEAANERYGWWSSQLQFIMNVHLANFGRSTLATLSFCCTKCLWDINILRCTTF